MGPGNVRLSIPQLGQPCHFWIYSRGREGFVTQKGLARGIEAGDAYRTVRIQCQ